MSLTSSTDKIDMGNQYYEEPEPMNRIRTIPVAFTLVAIVLANIVQVWCSWLNSPRRFVLCHLVVFLSFSFAEFLMRHEHLRLRGLGYRKIYVHGNCIIRYCFLIVAYTNATLTTVYVFYPPEKGDLSTNTSSRAFKLALPSVVEGGFVLWLLYAYMKLCLQHNTSPNMEEGLRTTSTLSSSGNTAQLEQQIRKLQEQLRAHQTPVSQPAQTHRNSVSGLASGRYATFEDGNSTSELPSTKDQEIRMLRAERDRLRGELDKMTENFEKFTATTEQLRKESENQLVQISKQKKRIRQLAKENQQFAVLLEVHKETNSNAQKLLESLAKPGAGSLQGGVDYGLGEEREVSAANDHPNDDDPFS